MRVQSIIPVLIYLLSAMPVSGCRDDQTGMLPTFNILLENGTVISTGNIPSGKPVVMIYYSGECGDCHNEAREIMERIDELKDVRFYFVTVEPIKEVKRFVEYLDIGRFENITVGADTGKYFPNYLQANSTPVLALYDKRKRLRGIFGNKPQVDTLIAKIREL